MAETIRAAALTGYADLARDIGLDPLRMLDVAGIPRAALTDGDMRIRAWALRDLYELCSRNAEDFGLRLMERRSLSVMGPVMLIVREQPTVRAALTAVIRHNALHNEATILKLDEVGELAVISLVMRFETPGPQRQAAEASLAQVARILRLFLGVGWRPLSASFVHSPPSSLAAHHKVFGPGLLFNHDAYSITCDGADLERRNEAADPEMARQIERYVVGLSQSADRDLASRVADSIRDLLASGRCNIGMVAERMALDPRTLQRQLARDGAGFQDILHRVRLELAAQYLEESARPLAEISELLGFSALSAFSRWHRTHCGQSAVARRRHARPAAAR